jgi:hypothetical protein
VRIAIGAEQQAVGNGTDLAAELRGRGRGRRRRLGQLADLALDAQRRQLAGDVLCALMRRASLALPCVPPASDYRARARRRQS